MAIRIQIKNTRSISEASVTLELGKCTVVVGRNNAGKSTLLEVCDLALTSLPGSMNLSQLPVTAYRLQRGQRVRPSVVVDLSPKDDTGNDRVAPDQATLRVEFVAGRHPAHIRSSETGTTQLVPIQYTLTFASGVQRVLLRLVGRERLENSTGLDDGAPYALVHDVLLNGGAWATLTDKLEESFPAQQNHDQVRQLGRPFQAQHPFSANVYRLRAGRVPNFAPATIDNRITQDGHHNVTGYLKRLFYHPPTWRKLVLGTTLIFDDVVDVLLEEMGDGMAPFILTKHGEKRLLSDMGYGLQNIVYTLAVLLAIPSQSVVLIDEPEAGLNQSLQRDFASLLEVARSDVFILAATQAEFFCNGLSGSSLHVAESGDDGTVVSKVDITRQDDRRRVARTLGIDPLYLLEQGKILYVEGPSDSEVVRQWLSLHLPLLGDRLSIHELGGAGKIGEEFAKPMFVKFRERVFFLLDSDGTSDASPMSESTARRVAWFNENDIRQFHVLKKKELENYLGCEAIATACGINQRKIAPSGNPDWWDIKEAVTREQGFYDERRAAREAYALLDHDRKRNLFGAENDDILRKIREFLG